jgi:hypothetical protein
MWIFCSKISNGGLTCCQLGLKKRDMPGAFRIFSGAELLSNQDKVEPYQSDASGTDGFGYVLKDIYERCDTLNTQLLAWWVPRELNNLADHLSHLAALLNEDTVEGVQVDRLKA